jgi:GH18 family chitinase
MNRSASFWTLILLAVIVSACAAPTAVPVTPAPSVTPTPAPEPFRIIAYAGYGAPLMSAEQMSYLTHINYAFLTPKSDGTFDPIVNGWKLKKLAEMAHKDNHAKVLISVGGWGYDDQFETVAADPVLRATFVSGLQKIVADYSIDGVDIDWEYPDAGQSSQNFLVLMRELRAAFPAGRYLLTSAVVVYGENGDSIPTESFELVDFLNIMAYDGPDHSTYELAVQALDYWAGRGLSPEKTVLGVPFYSRPNEVSFSRLVNADPKSAWTDTFNFAGEQHYNGIPTIQRKTLLAMQRAHGIMFWEFSQDAVGEYSLLAAIHRTVTTGQADATPTP